MRSVWNIIIGKGIRINNHKLYDQIILLLVKGIPFYLFIYLSTEITFNAFLNLDSIYFLNEDENMRRVCLSVWYNLVKSELTFWSDSCSNECVNVLFFLYCFCILTDFNLSDFYLYLINMFSFSFESSSILLSIFVIVVVVALLSIYSFHLLTITCLFTFSQFTLTQFSLLTFHYFHTFNFFFFFTFRWNYILVSVLFFLPQSSL